METLRAFLSGCMASLSFSSPKGSAEALPEVFCPLQNLPAPSHTANICRIRRLPTLTERLCEIAAIHRGGLQITDQMVHYCNESLSWRTHAAQPQTTGHRTPEVAGDQKSGSVRVCQSE